MAYMRIRNGYAYICEKVKVQGRWKEETLASLGKIISEENVKRGNLIKEHGNKLDPETNIGRKDFEELKKLLLEEINEGSKKRETGIEEIWVYKNDNEETFLIKTSRGMYFELSEKW